MVRGHKTVAALAAVAGLTLPMLAVGQQGGGSGSGQGDQRQQPGQQQPGQQQPGSQQPARPGTQQPGDTRQPGDIRQQPGRDGSGTGMAQAARSEQEFFAKAAHHHVGEVEMIRFAAAHAERSEVKQLAQRLLEMKTDQQLQLERRALELGGPAHMVDPQMKQRAMQQLERVHTAPPEQIDQAFLTQIIAHHEDAAQFFRASLPVIRDEEGRSQAQRMLNMMEEEIAQFRELQGQNQRTTRGNDTMPGTRQPGTQPGNQPGTQPGQQPGRGNQPGGPR